MWPFVASIPGTIATSGSSPRFVCDHTCHVWRVTCHVAAPQPVSAAVRLPRVPGRVEHAVRGPGLRVSHQYWRDMSWWCGYSAAGEPSDASTRSLSRQLSPRRIFIWSRSTECHRAGASGAAARWELHFPRDVFIIHSPSEAWTRIHEASCPHSDIDIVMETQLWCRCQPENMILHLHHPGPHNVYVYYLLTTSGCQN